MAMNCSACCTLPLKAFHRRLPQPLQQQIGAAPHVQDHRQVVLLGQLQLRCVKELLTRHVQAGHKTVQADFTHRHQTRVGAVVCQGLVQGLQIGLAGLRCEKGVDAQRVNVAVLVRQLPHRVKVRGLHRRDDAGVHAHRAGGLTHRVAVRREFGGVQVAVAVDPSHGAW
jgi:hypothetical protein